MKKRKYYTPLLIALFAWIIVISVSSCSASKVKPQAKSGHLDLSTGKELDKGVVALSGEWEFFWDKIYAPNEIPPITQNTVVLPGLWNGIPQAQGQDRPGFGFATYRLSLSLPQSGRYGIKIRELDNAYTLWINGEKLGSVGTPSKNPEFSEPSWRREEFYFPSKEELEIVLNVSNWEHRKGGPEELIFFGYEKDIRGLKLALLFLDLSIGGASLVIGLYHLFLFLQRRKEKLYLVFFILSLLVFSRSLFCGEKIILNIFPAFPWHLSMQLDYISSFYVIPVMIALICYMFPSVNHIWISPLYFIGITILSLVVLFTDPWIGSYTMNIFQVIGFACIIHGNILLFKAAWRRYPQALAMLVGFFLLSITAIMDVLFVNGIFVFPGHLLQSGFLIMMMFEAFCLAGRFTRAMLSNENNLERLHRLNTSLTRFVPVEFMHFLERDSFSESGISSQLCSELALVHLSITDSQGCLLDSPMHLAQFDRFIAKLFPQVSEKGGFVESIRGGSLVLIFPIHASRAVSACLAFAREIVNMKKELSSGEENSPQAYFQMFSGIHWGTFEGSPKFEHTKELGSDTSHIAERIRELAVLFGSTILVSQDICRQLGALEEWNIRFICRIKVKTRLMPIAVYELFTSLPPESRALTLSTRELFEIAVQDFWRGQHNEALASFEFILRLHPEDKTAAKFCEWIRSPSLFEQESSLLR